MMKFAKKNFSLAPLTLLARVKMKIKTHPCKFVVLVLFCLVFIPPVIGYIKKRIIYNEIRQKYCTNSGVIKHVQQIDLSDGILIEEEGEPPSDKPLVQEGTRDGVFWLDTYFNIKYFKSIDMYWHGNPRLSRYRGGLYEGWLEGVNYTLNGIPLAAGYYKITNTSGCYDSDCSFKMDKEKKLKGTVEKIVSSNAKFILKYKNMACEIYKKNYIICDTYHILVDRRTGQVVAENHHYMYGGYEGASKDFVKDSKNNNYGPFVSDCNDGENKANPARSVYTYDAFLNMIGK